MRSIGTGGDGHVFVDNVRFWSMFSIVAMHSLWIFQMMKQPAPVMELVVMTPFKFGTIGFFLISGFLVGSGLTMCRPSEYMGKRIRKIFVPWVFWFTLMLVYLIVVNEVHQHMGIGFDVRGYRIFGKLAYGAMFSSAFWFVPNLLLGMYLLVLFRRHLDNLGLGAALLAIDLFYVVNIYAQWIPSSHTEAVLGFVFYLWLGGYAARHFEALMAWLDSVPMGVVMTAAAVAAGCALGESLWLRRLGVMDNLNTLRLSNQVFSVLVVLCFVKVKRRTWPKFVQVRRETFGLYLTHVMLLDIVLRSVQAVFRRAPKSWLPTTHVGLLMEWLTVFAVTYGLGITAARLLAGWRSTQGLVGLGAAPRAKVEVAFARGSEHVVGAEESAG